MIYNKKNIGNSTCSGRVEIRKFLASREFRVSRDIFKEFPGGSSKGGSAKIFHPIASLPTDRQDPPNTTRTQAILTGTRP